MSQENIELVRSMLAPLDGVDVGGLDWGDAEMRAIESIPAVTLPRRDVTDATVITAAIATSTASTRQKVSLRRMRRRSTITSASSDMSLSNCASRPDSGAAGVPGQWRW